MRLYTAFVAECLFPLHEALKRHPTVGVRRHLETSQWLRWDEIAALQIRRARQFLTDCAAEVPYYRDLFRSCGFDPSRFDDLAQLRRLPLLTKPIIRANFDRLKSEHRPPGRLFSTTGSTGDPLRFHISPTRVAHDVAAKWRATRWWGVDIGDREIVLWSSPIELTGQDRVKQLRDWLFRSKLLPGLSVSQSELDDYIEQIRSFRPAMLFGYPSLLTIIAQRAEKSGRRLDDLGVKVAFCTAERLYPHQIASIERVFGCPVANGYGGRDSGFIAHACPAGSLHITAEDLIVEIVGADGRPQPPGVSGAVAITHLYSDGFPFVRYLNGDVASIDETPCSCGRGLPVMREIQGRSNDILLGEDGSVVKDTAISVALRDMTGVNGFKVIQETLTHCRLLLVCDQSFDRESSEAEIRAAIAARLGGGVRLDIEYVIAIEPEKSGKYRYVVSKVSQQKAGAPADAV
jgi:phenylacetate-CoA ligase